MAYYFLFPEKDTTIYNHPYRTDLNTGRVETLSLTSEKGATDDLYYPSRILIKFKDSEITNVISNTISGSFSSNLKLYATEFNYNLPISQTMELYPLYESWENGTQRYEDHPYFSGVVSDGASWLYKNDGTSKTSWTFPLEGITNNITSSFSGSIINGIGGTWYTGSEFVSTQSIDLTTDLDLNFDVTSQIQKFSSSLFTGATHPTGITNNGFIIKRENDVFNNSSDQGTLKYFSGDTHTIFSPTLIFKWDDSLYVVPKTTYVSILSTGKIQLNVTNLKQEYKQSEEPTIKIHARPQYPDREFTTTSSYTKPYFLNATAYYSIEDYTSKEVIIPFDTDYTKISANSDGMYFKLYMQGLQPERYYRLLIRHDNNDGINIYDENWYFKVTR